MATVSYIYSSGLDYPRKGNDILDRKRDIFLGNHRLGFAEDTLGRIKQQRRNSDDLFISMRIFLIFGKLIGLVPIQGLFQRNVEQIKFRKSSISGIVSVVIWILMLVNAVVGFIGMSKGTRTNAGQYAWAPAMLSFYSLGLFAYVYYYQHCWDLIHIFQNWAKMSLTFTKTDSSLFRDINLIAGLILTSGILENILSSINQTPLVPSVQGDKKGAHPINASLLEVYYNRSQPTWAALVPYHPFMAFYVFISNKFAVYAWNYMDLTIAIMSRALYFKFKILCKQSEAIMVGTQNYYDESKWKELTKDHETLCSMLFEIGTFLSPLIFLSFGMNVYYICLQLHLGLTPNCTSSVTESIYAVWSFLHLVIRVYVISLSAARINDWAHRITDVFRKCPNETYTTEVERTERFVSVNTIGLTGLGCFIITKPLILQLVGVVFTFEIVLLQASQTQLTDAPVNTSSLCKPA